MAWCIAVQCLASLPITRAPIFTVRFFIAEPVNQTWTGRWWRARPSLTPVWAHRGRIFSR